ncbi:hypothetical protein DENSPDRAFT_152498 [Dentipellis sp. KUC8613]|nr:hypothetical protein DENSPDRAFT_152498 [Dentipellis sp. KUC8613]
MALSSRLGPPPATTSEVSVLTISNIPPPNPRTLRQALCTMGRRHQASVYKKVPKTSSRLWQSLTQSHLRGCSNLVTMSRTRCG